MYLVVLARRLWVKAVRWQRNLTSARGCSARGAFLALKTEAAAPVHSFRCSVGQMILRISRRSSESSEPRGRSDNKLGAAFAASLSTALTALRLLREIELRCRPVEDSIKAAHHIS